MGKHHKDNHHKDKKGARDRLVDPLAPTGLAELLRASDGPVRLSETDPRSTPGFPGRGKKDAPAVTADLGRRLADVQERLWAESRTGGTAARVLVVLQGMDTSGKGGVIRHAIGMIDPQGVEITAFKKPTDEELRHPFLWRIRRSLPGPGMIGIFDRSHYEDVLIVRVHELVARAIWRRRYASINDFESGLVDSGTTVIKCMLHISRDEQRDRLGERLSRPDKYWKYNPGDIDERARWDDYTTAYEEALTRCNSADVPWFIIPSDRKWYRNWAVARLLLEHLERLDPQWPPADFDVEQERARLAAS